MYNEELKKRFIEERESNVTLASNSLQNLFNKSEKYEEANEKDISCFSVGEILDFYKMVQTKSIDVLININSQLNTYTSWCMSRNLIPTGINNYSEITSEMLGFCVNKLAMETGILSEKQVHEIVNRMKNPREQFLLLMLYETGKTKNLRNVFYAKIDDFNVDACKLRTVDGRKVNVSPRLCEIAQKANAEKKYHSYINVPDSRTAGRQRYLVDRGYIYKETDTVTNDTSPAVKVNRAQIGIKKSFEILGIPKWVSLKDFQNSGIINHIKQLATENNMTCEDVIYDIDLREKVEYQHATKIVPKNFIRRFKDFL